jgi:MFS family permease
MEQQLPMKMRWSMLLGNIFEHYDTALYGLLSPFLAPLFFPFHDKLTALLLTYAIIPLSIFIRPLGALVFGYIGDRYSRKKALRMSLIGTAVTTAAFGLIPTYAHVGVLAPVLLSLGRLCQSFFAAGEVVGGAIFLIENTSEKQKNRISSLFGSTTIVGILLASIAVSAFYQLELIEQYWRALFLLGAFTAVISFFLRQCPLSDSTEHPTSFQFSEVFKQSLKDFRLFQKPIVAIIFASGFSYACYAIPFVMMNGLLPMVSALSKAEMIYFNTIFLGVDLVLLLVFARLANFFTPEKIMLSAAIAAIVTAAPLFWLMQGASYPLMLMIRLVFVVIGVGFSAPFYAWVENLVPASHRYTVVSFSYAIGSQLFGSATSMISLWLFQQSNSTVTAALYWIFLASVSGYFIHSMRNATSQHKKTGYARSQAAG